MGKRRPSVGIRLLKANLSAWLKRAANGEIIDVTDRGRVVARLSGALRDGPASPAGGAALLVRLARERRPGWRRDGSANVDRYLAEDIGGS
jgi:antitoxin (DNA-binding transcriptional repressor) of toxin-antitoxin stability system